MQFPSVNWHEGLFLQPHHFQAWDRHWTERVCVGEQWQSPYGYGLLEIAINSQALASGFLQLDALRCKTPGGMLIDFSQGQFSERRDLRPALELISNTQQPQRGSAPIGHAPRQVAPFLDVFAAVPRLQLGNKNVDSGDHPNGARFRAQWLDLPDEVDAASVQAVELRQLNAKILLSTDDLAGYDTLRIARVRRSDQEGTQVQLDSQYIPPLLDCAAWRPLGIHVLASTHDMMQQYSEQFAHQLFDAGGSLHANTPIDVQRLLVLQAVNPAASVLRVLSQSRGIHPLVAYLELVRLAGTLDLLHPHRVAKATSPYDHENLGGIFFELKRRILHAVEGLHSVPYRQFTFIGNEHGMQISIDRTQFSTQRRWYLGVQKGSLKAEDVHELLAPSNLDWKLGSLSQVEKLFTQRAPGVDLKRTLQVPASLPKSDEWVYYEVEGLDRSAWKDVEATGTLALRIRDSLILNREQLPGEQILKVALGRQSVSLKFALFGVD